MNNETTIGKTVIAWYRSALEEKGGTSRAARARLRRCETPAEVLAIEETHELNRRLREIGRKPTADQLALLATIFARIRDVRGSKLAAMFGKRQTKDGPRPLSELRFQVLIHARSHRDLIVPLRRSLAILGQNAACDGQTLAEDLYFWGEGVRNRWCFQYFGVESAITNQGETMQ